MACVTGTQPAWKYYFHRWIALNYEVEITVVINKVFWWHLVLQLLALIITSVCFSSGSSSQVWVSLPITASLCVSHDYGRLELLELLEPLEPLEPLEQVMSCNKNYGPSLFAQLISALPLNDLFLLSLSVWSLSLNKINIQFLFLLHFPDWTILTETRAL